MKEEKIYLDKKGYENYLKEIDDLRKLINANGKTKSNAYTGAVGDGWHDNFEFEEAKREELRIQRQLRDKVEGLSRIVIVDKSENEELIDIDDSVKIKMIFAPDDIEEMEIKLVGDTSHSYDEITLNSPLGKAIYHQTVGSSVSYEVDGNNINVEILSCSKNNDLNDLVRKR